MAKASRPTAWDRSTTASSCRRSARSRPRCVQWEIGLSAANDPWQHLSTWSCSAANRRAIHIRDVSGTGRRAIGNLLRHYDRLRKRRRHYPFVRLKVSGYNHRDERVGWVNMPVFAVVGKPPKASAAIPDTSPSGDLDDAISF